MFSPSSSTAIDPNAFNIPYFRQHFNSEMTDSDDNTHYSLMDVAKFLHIRVGDYQHFSKREINQKLGIACIMNLIKKSEGTFEITSDQEIPMIDTLSPLWCTTKMRPDIVVYENGDESIKLVVEIQSSPMAPTIRKSVLEAATILRLLRWRNVDVTEMSVFTLPNVNKDKGACICEIEINWNSEFLQFEYNAKRHKSIQDGVSVLKNALHHNCYKLPEDPSPYCFPLSSNDISHLCGSYGKQMKNERRVMVNCTDGYIYKVSYSGGVQLLWRYIPLLQNCKNVILPELLSHPTISDDIINYKYAAAKYCPLSRKEIQKCFRSFVRGAKKALDELHSVGLAHNDVRIENFCFSSTFEMILIDLDRCTCVNFKSVFTHGSCMYISPPNFDGMQLGWMVAWVLEATDWYHDRRLETLSQTLREEKFVMKLLTRGEFCEQLLCESASIVDKLTLQQVITYRLLCISFLPFYLFTFQGKGL